LKELLISFLSTVGTLRCFEKLNCLVLYFVEGVCAFEDPFGVIILIFGDVYIFRPAFDLGVLGVLIEKLF
jgi:hypothetical protein